MDLDHVYGGMETTMWSLRNERVNGWAKEKFCLELWLRIVIRMDWSSLDTLTDLIEKDNSG
jgi:hypothetical protein